MLRANYMYVCRSVGAAADGLGIPQAPVSPRPGSLRFVVGPLHCGRDEIQSRG